MSAFENHYTVQEIAEKWHLSETVIRKLFRDEPGVIKIDSPERLRDPELARRSARDLAGTNG